MHGRASLIYRMLLLFAWLGTVSAAAFAVMRLTVYRSFEEIERRRATEPMARCAAAIESEKARISSICHDWGLWDDAYGFVKDRNSAFIKSNFSDTMLENNRISFVCIAEIQGDILHFHGYDPAIPKSLNFKDLSGKVQGGFTKMLWLPAPQSQVSGIIATEHGPLIVSSNPILTTNGEGPILGAVLMGRLVDKQLIDEISYKTGTADLAFSTTSPDDGTESARGNRIFIDQKYLVEDIGGSLFKVSWTALDLDGSPLFTLSTTCRRDITTQAAREISMAMIFFFIVAVMLTAFFHLMQQRLKPRGGIGGIGWTRRHTAVVALITVVGIAMSLILFHIARKIGHIQQMQSFERMEAIPLKLALEKELSNMENDVRSLVSFFDSSQFVSRSEFRTFTSSILTDNNSIQNIIWIPRVADDAREKYEKELSEDLGTPCRFTCLADGGTLAPSPRQDEYYPVFYFEPAAGNGIMAGYDLASDDKIKAALAEAATNGRQTAVIGARIPQEKPSSGGFMFLQPVYTKDRPMETAADRVSALQGYAAGTFIFKDIFSRLVSTADWNEMAVELADLGKRGEEMKVLYSSINNSTISRGMALTHKIPFGGREWMLTVCPTRHFLSMNASMAPYHALFIGLLAAIVVALLASSHIHKTLAEGQSQYRQLFHEMMSGFALHEIICDEKGTPVDYRFLAVNEAFEQLTGMKSKNVIGRTAKELIPDLEESWIERYGKVALSEEPVFFEQYSAPLNKFFEIRAFSPEKGRFATIFNDITGRRKTEMALEAAAKEWTSTFDAVSDAVCLLDSEFRIVRCNKAMAAFAGMESSQLAGKHCWEIVHGTKEPVPQCPVLRMISTRQKESQELKIGERWFQVKADPILGENTSIRGAVHIVSDITERKLSEEERLRLEEQLHQAQKMESVGRLAGGIAHDFNNLLTPILGYADILRMDLPQDDPRRAQIEQMKSAAESAKDLTRQLLAFGRKQMLDLKTVNLKDVIKKISKIIKRTIREDIRIEFDLPDGIRPVKADIGQIEQIVINLAINAQDAMPNGGTLKFTLENTRLEDKDSADFQDLVPGDYTCMTVSDTGHGMDKAVMDHIFEPFFTTKAIGKGTGLGLSTVYGIVKQHAGQIKVFSELGKGSSFKIYFPATQQVEKVPAAQPAPAPRPDSGGETIAIVEDNEMVMNIAKLILENLKFKVICFARPEECLQFFEKSSEHVDMLITDVIMPLISGRELYERIRAKRPRIKILFMSGYERDLIAQRGIMEAGTHFLQKPFTAESLHAKVREVLDS